MCAECFDRDFKKSSRVGLSGRKLSRPAKCKCGAIMLGSKLYPEFGGLTDREDKYHRMHKAYFDSHGNKLYCHDRKCGSWIPRSEGKFVMSEGKKLGQVGRCTLCKSDTCTACKEEWQTGHQCPKA